MTRLFRHAALPAWLLLGIASIAAADAIPAIQRRLPPAGQPLSEDVRANLEAELAQGKKRLATHADHALSPDVEIFTSAVELALAHDEFYGSGDAALAAELLKAANHRMDDLAHQQSPWTTQRGALVRGYRSSVDGSVQPYGLVIPPKLDLSKPAPLYVWLHGRGDAKTNMAFLRERQTKAGQIAPDDAIVLHPFGRHCIGFKSAGEIDVLEAIDHVCAQYNIDRGRIVLMGFSMGGAGCWHIGAHYADHFVAMSPGAGFAETAEYQNLKPGDVPWYERKLWGAYDVPCYTRNLFNLPVVAYSGENDKQIQAARVMERAFRNEGAVLTHLIGPGMGHKYYPDTLQEILRRMKLARDQKAETAPKKVYLQTQTLRYNKMHWVELQGLEAHWEGAVVDASYDKDAVQMTMHGVTAVRLTPPNVKDVETVYINGKPIKVDPLELDSGRPVISLVKAGDNWESGPTERNSLGKTPGLQGPIDDAFLDPFLVVLPSGKCRHERVQQWVDFESEHFLKRWRALFRGSPRVKRDTEVTADDLAKYHLILWGDPQSNAVIRRLADWGPIHWNEESLSVGEQKYAAEQHVPVYIYPNREALNRYIVINSGPTFREGHDRTNSLQNPKLPDWAIVDISQPPDALAPGKIVAADFFDESWRLRAKNESD